MPKFKVIISDPETGRSKSLEMEETRSALLVGRKLGEVIDGSVVGMPSYKLQITGGSDKDGFPMRHDVHGGVRVNVIVGEGTGFRPSSKGERRRKALRGNVITEDIIQVNMKIVEKPKKAEEEMKKEKETVEGKAQAT
ncbi:MAG: 30S ribosomal protein S6e [Candidatus Bathyarchaeia archaeon]